ncbi:MAG TPA: hypothetical protein VI685_17890 [Candidatus Angelobacter sp.]
MKKMQRAGAVLIVLTLAVTLLSCSKSVAGTYVSNKDAQMSLELKGNGSFAVYQKNKTTALATGTYKVDGTVITLVITGENKPGTGKLEGDLLTDPDGNTWKKQP